MTEGNCLLWKWKKRKKKSFSFGQVKSEITWFWESKLKLICRKWVFDDKIIDFNVDFHLIFQIISF